MSVAIVYELVASVLLELEDEGWLTNLLVLEDINDLLYLCCSNVLNNIEYTRFLGGDISYLVE